jgi:hypothetical protein
VKRNLFAELTEGFDALKAEREGKRTLRTFNKSGSDHRNTLIRGSNSSNSGHPRGLKARY